MLFKPHTSNPANYDISKEQGRKVATLGFSIKETYPSEKPRSFQFRR
ncbi:MAG: hypothetical protein Ct9H90mP11_08670 [Acidimicrobiales bacterium]|nr:MAG: hypothetical protein Ct9H90mP11_08670 [Acidimicrobiales bacterium]